MATATKTDTPELSEDTPESELELLRRQVDLLRQEVKTMQQDDILPLAHHSVRQNGQTPWLVAIIERYQGDGLETRPYKAPERRVGGAAND
ncbi:MAG: hypothetical protein ABSG93_18935 [Solirubrobacteraceae bacterium]